LPTVCWAIKEPYPTSTLIEVKGFVPPDALIEINAMAALKNHSAQKEEKNEL
jgi:enamine deaminase RidA (YjgF/YER057c/UK114 family)